MEDYRQSLIYETVTKGLDKTVPLKASGVDWIGQIPEGWEIGRLKDFVKFQTGTTPPQSVGVNQDESGVPWFKPGDFSDNSIDLLSSENHITHEVVMQYNLSVYPKNNFISWYCEYRKSRLFSATFLFESTDNCLEDNWGNLS